MDPTVPLRRAAVPSFFYITAILGFQDGRHMKKTHVLSISHRLNHLQLQLW